VPGAVYGKPLVTSDQIRPEYCTCGAKLVENARFCHLCGRPVFEPETPEPVAAPPVTNLAPEAPAARVQLPVSFSNPIAVRVAFLMSLITMLLTALPVVQLLFPVWCLVAGSCAVLLYRRLTGMSLSVRAGARLGSITGVLAFLFLVAVTAMEMAFTGQKVFQEIAKQNPEASQVLNNPTMLAFSASVFLVLLFAIVVGICTAGGALGARLANRDAKV
jgi:hypothetical protein